MISQIFRTARPLQLLYQSTFKSAYYISVKEQKLNIPLKEYDPELYNLIKGEAQRQKEGINLIAAENHSSKAVMSAVGSVMNSKYSEGLPGARYYGGNQLIDQAESLCINRALQTFKLDSKQWWCNVQPLSGSLANFCVYTGLLGPHERMMSLELTHGGHISHGYQSRTKKVSGVSVYFEVLPYQVHPKTMEIDYDRLNDLASLYKPKVIVAGASSYTRLIDYQKIKDTCVKNNAILVVDIAHIAGLIAAGVIPSPFEYADVVTTTTHKTLRGPRGAIIFFRVGVKKDKKGKEIQYDLQKRIEPALFPGLQGGPHNHTISAISVALQEAQSQEFKLYQKQVLSNAKQMEKDFLKKNYTLVSGGTDTHMLLIDLKNKGIDGATLESLLEQVNIFTNKNFIPFDKSISSPSGIRLGTPTMTTRGLIEKDFTQIVDFIDQAISIYPQVNAQLGKPAQGMEFKDSLAKKANEIKQVQKLKQDVLSFTKQWGVPGLE